MIIACVFRESKTFTSKYVDVFSSVFNEYHPEYDQICLTDYDGKFSSKKIEKIKLKYAPQKPDDNWFSKMELFRPDIEDDIFYCDLDNVIVSPLHKFFQYHEKHPNEPFMINDVDPKQKRLQSAVMYIPYNNDVRSSVWNRFERKRDFLMRTANKFGDAKIIRETELWASRCKTYQSTFHSNCIVSYRHGWHSGVKNKNGNNNNDGVKIVCMHGKNEKPLNPKYADSPLIKDHFLKYLLKS